MKIKINDTNGLILKTKDKVCKEDIEIILDESLGSVNKGYHFQRDVSSYGAPQYPNKVFYSLDGGTNWIDIYEYHVTSNRFKMWLFNVSEIMIKVCGNGTAWGIFDSATLGVHLEIEYGEIIRTFTLTQDVLDAHFGTGYPTGGGGGA